MPERAVPEEGALGRLILADDLGLQVGFHLSWLVTIGKVYPSWFVLSCTPSIFMTLGPHVRSGKAHGQVGGSSGKSGPPVEDGRDPGRWVPWVPMSLTFGVTVLSQHTPIRAG
jgi:hypothetical protein